MSNLKPNFVFIKMQGCPHCETFQKVWDELLNDNELANKVNFNQYDMGDNYPNQYKKYTENGYPTILLEVGNEIFPYVRDREVDIIKKFIDTHIKQKGGKKQKINKPLDDDEQYKVKYLKYKAKYLKLKSLKF